MLYPIQIPLWAELTAVGLGALQGAMFAAAFKERRIDMLGVAIIGISVALGGSFLRDLLLDTLPVVIRSNWYLLVAVAAALIGMALERVFSRVHVLIDVLDAVVIGLFGVIGATKALTLGVPAVPAIGIGILAAVGGSVLRDVSMGLPIAFLHVGSFYALAAGTGTMLLVVLVAAGVEVPIAAVVGVALTVIVRLASIRFGWTVPEQRGLGHGQLRSRPPAEPKGIAGADADLATARQCVQATRGHGA